MQNTTIRLSVPQWIAEQWREMHESNGYRQNAVTNGAALLCFINADEESRNNAVDLVQNCNMEIDFVEAVQKIMGDEVALEELGLHDERDPRLDDVDPQDD